MQIKMRRDGFWRSACQRNERLFCRLFRGRLLRRRCGFRVDSNCRGRDSCDTGVGTVTLPVGAGAGGSLLCRSEEAGDVCATVCGGFSALPPCAGIGRCEARCSAGRAASDRAVERGGVPASRLEDGAAGDTGVVGAGCSRFVERPSIRTPLDGCTVPPDCWAETWFCCVIWVFPFVETRVVCCTGWV